MKRSSRSRRHRPSESRHRGRSTSSSSVSSCSIISLLSSPGRYSSRDRKKRREDVHISSHRHDRDRRDRDRERDDSREPRSRPNPKSMGSTRSMDPKMVASRIFIGGLPEECDVTKEDMLEIFSKFGKIIGVTILKGYAFVQFDSEEGAKEATTAKDLMFKDTLLDVRNHESKQKSHRHYPRDGQEKSSTSHPPHPATPQGEGPPSAPSDQPHPMVPMMPAGFYQPSMMIPPPFFRPPPPGFFPRDPFPRDMFLREPYPREPFRPPMGQMPTFPLRPPPRIGEAGASDSYRDFQKVTPPQSGDCQIIVVDEAAGAYADSVKKRLLSCGLTADILCLRTNETTLSCVEDVKRSRIPFAVIINEQNQLRKSITVNILHGSPQEHRNMPLEDAIILISRSFDKYVLERKKEAKGNCPDFSPPTKTIVYIMNLIMEEKIVTADELDLVIDYLTDRRDLLLQSTGQKTKKKKMMAHSKSPDQSDATESKGELTSDFEIQLLKMLMSEKHPSSDKINSEKMKEKKKPQPVPPPPKINMDDPDIKKALDNLISTGPNLLKNISKMGGGETGRPSNSGDKWDGYQY